MDLRRTILFSLYSIVTIGLVVFNVFIHGKKNLKLKKHWGYVIACDHILYIHGVTVTECVEECLYRMNCKSVNYIVHHKYCELCANEDNNVSVRRNGGAYIQKSEITQENDAQWCNCSSRETCRNVWRKSHCQTEECGTAPRIGPRTRSLGNQRQIGSKVIYLCEGKGYQNKRALSTCQEDGTWTVSNITCKKSVREYVGCYEDDWTRTLLGSTDLRHTTEMTIEMCEAHCVELLYPYFGVEFRFICFCGDVVPPDKKRRDSDCNMPCAGNRKQICGSAFRLTVYTTPI